MSLLDAILIVIGETTHKLEKMSKNHLRTLRQFIVEAVKETKEKNYDFGYAGSYPEEEYKTELLDDPSYKKKSLYVPDDIKGKIDKWAEDMGLSTRKSKKNT